MEDIIRVKKIQLKLYPCANNLVELRKYEAKLKRFLNLEEEFWKQKLGMR